MKISFKDLDPRIITDFVEEKDGVIYATCHLRNKTPVCPCCNKKVTPHSYFTHTFYDLPIQNKPVLISLTKRKYLCRNKNCNCKTFSDKTDFISPKGRKTKRLIKNIVALTKDMNSVQTSKNLKELGIIAKKSAICNYLKKTKITIPDLSQVKALCIDDFAKKKKHSYGTIFINADTNKIINIIDSREADDVTSELKKYPNLKIVSRDGSWTYGKLLLTIIKILAKLQTGFIYLKI